VSRIATLAAGILMIVSLVADNTTIVEYGQSSRKAQLWRYVDFDESMLSDAYPSAIAATRHVMGYMGPDFMDLCRDLYERYNPSVFLPQREPTIPKVIHQIWLGGQVPEQFKPFMETWIEAHVGRGWQYKLWTDEDLKDLTLYTQDYFDKTKNFGVKADLLRFEILYRYGGVYIDLDFECLQPLDELHHLYDFYTALQPLDSKVVQLGSALVGARPQHPIIRQYLVGIKDSWGERGVLRRTGPVHYSRMFYLTAGRGGNRDIAFPAGYFYPLGCRETEVKREEWIKRGAYGIHHWSSVWLPHWGRRKQFQSIRNDENTVNWREVEV